MVTNEKSDDAGILWRLILAVIGLLIALAGWSLIMTAILSFIGLPLFIFGLALAQAQES
jgi:hypothetical protein